MKDAHEILGQISLLVTKIPEVRGVAVAPAIEGEAVAVDGATALAAAALVAAAKRRFFRLMYFFIIFAFAVNLATCIQLIKTSK